MGAWSLMWKVSIPYADNMRLYINVTGYTAHNLNLQRSPVSHGLFTNASLNIAYFREVFGYFTRAFARTARIIHLQ